ncbi:MAG: energy-coupling factor transporter transmembrane protein EcfT [Candidatus Eisenbacteria bacterium]|nr:energy-coupling factor transporter transmembrane protein EcfT [Candidatus Eisenbacteria bacterium]
MLPQSPIGRYVDTGSIVHSLDARAKSVCLLLLLAACFSIHSLWSLGLVVALFLTVTILSRLPFRTAIGNGRLLLLFLGLAVVFNALFWQPASSVSLFVMPHPHLAGLVRGAWAGAKLIVMMSFVNLFLLCTAPEECTEAVAFFLSPLKRIVRGVAGVPMVVTIALRFVPLVLAEGNRIMIAQRARGMRAERRLTGRIRDLRPLVVPLFRSVLTRADQLSVALEVRCFDPSRPRRSAFARNFSLRDAGALLCCVCVLVLVRILG